MTDEQIVKKVRENDREAYAEIIRRYQDKLVRYAAYLTGDNAKAADVAQETLTKAYINLYGFDVKKKFASWLYRIAHNEAMGVWRRNARFRPLPAGVDFDSGVDMEDDLVKKDLREHAHECLSRMPVSYREPLALFFLEEKSYGEISDILRISVGSVGVRIHRAKIMMKKICQQREK